MLARDFHLSLEEFGSDWSSALRDLNVTPNSIPAPRFIESLRWVATLFRLTQEQLEDFSELDRKRSRVWADARGVAEALTRSLSLNL